MLQYVLDLAASEKNSDIVTVIRKRKIHVHDTESGYWRLRVASEDQLSRAECAKLRERNYRGQPVVFRQKTRRVYTYGCGELMVTSIRIMDNGSPVTRLSLIHI